MKKLALLALLPIGNILQAQSLSWEKTSFPDTNPVHSLTILDGKVFAGAQDGLYYSTDQGDTWIKATANQNVVAVNTVLKLGDVYYFSSWGYGVFRSADLATWEFMGDSLPLVSSIEFFDGKLYAGTGKSVYVFNPEKGYWESDGLKIPYYTSKFILGVKAYKGNLYAAGCEHMYKKSGGVWSTINVSFDYCGSKMLEMDGRIILNTSGAGILIFDSLDAGITKRIFVNPEDTLSYSAADIAIHDNELHAVSHNSVYYLDRDTTEYVCDGAVISMAFGLNNIFVGTNLDGIWKKGLGDARDLDVGINLEVHPTPSKGKLVTSYKIQTERSARLTFFDVMGKVVLEKEIAASGNDEIFLSTPGVYLAVLTSGSEKVVKKVIVQ